MFSQRRVFTEVTTWLKICCRPQGDYAGPVGEKQAK